MKLINFWFFVSILPLIFGDELLLVQTLFRHGDRTPTNAYPNDPYQETFWPFSWGQLTTTGMKQHFEQGMKIRDRYTTQIPFLSPQYKDYNVYVRSDDYNRTLMSAYAHLAGFYMDSNTTHPNGGHWPSHWTPVPVHTVELESDTLLRNPNCPRMTQIHEQRKHASAFQAFMAQQKPLLETISKNSGINTNYFKSYSGVEHFYASTSIERIYNLTLPSWITNSLWETYTNGKYLADDYLAGSDAFGEAFNVELVKLKGGVLLKTMIDNMDHAIQKQSKVKFFMYSAHDTTIAALLRTLQAKMEILGRNMPEYAATLIVELWKMADTHHYVRVLYVPNVESNPVVITQYIDGCDDKEFCLKDDFVARSQLFIPTDITAECKAQ